MTSSASQTKATQTTAAKTKPGTPGRPKDPSKGAAILEAARRLFVELGYEGTSMDQVAAEAGVSKLTVYSHFGDKERLFAEAVRAHCEQGMPTHLFDADPSMPLRERLTVIGRAFFAMVMTPQAIAGHRVLCTPQVANSQLANLFWEAGPQRVQDAFTALLERRIATGELEIDEPDRASAQFFTLLKGDPHAQAVFGYCCSGRDEHAPDAHIDAVVDLFLRAYAKR